MIHNGIEKNTIDHRNRDFHKSFGSVGFDTSNLPEIYDADRKLWMPNQNSFNPEFSLPPEPYGCTNFASADISSNLDGILKDPGLLESVTHANAKGGYSIKDSLKAAKKLGWFDGFYQITSEGILDWYDAICVALFIASSNEPQEATIGIPWYPEFEQVGSDGILSVPKDFTWRMGHDAVICGWSPKGLKLKSWQGKGYGDNGYCYMSRPLVNAIFNIDGTCAFAATNLTPDSIQRIDTTIVERIVSFIRNLLGLS